MVEHAFEKIVLDLYRDGNWKEIIKLKDTENSFEKHRILWIWPSLDDLNWFKVVINDRNISGIVSIGCGSGLLEWLMHKHLGITIIGVEVDRQWWLSNYSPPLFLKNVRFVDEENDDFEILPCQALLFCYFNDRSAFRNYMEQYRGSTVIVIGPGEGRGTCTDPTPFDNQFVELGWKLQASREIGSTKDYITVYVK